MSTVNKTVINTPNAPQAIGPYKFNYFNYKILVN